MIVNLIQRFVDQMDPFFLYLLNTLSNNLNDKAKYLCSHLSEINETHLDLSKGVTNRKIVCQIGALKIFEGLKSS